MKTEKVYNDNGLEIGREKRKSIANIVKSEQQLSLVYTASSKDEREVGGDTQSSVKKHC